MLNGRKYKQITKNKSSFVYNVKYHILGSGFLTDFFFLGFFVFYLHRWLEMFDVKIDEDQYVSQNEKRRCPKSSNLPVVMSSVTSFMFWPTLYWRKEIYNFAFIRSSCVYPLTLCRVKHGTISDFHVFILDESFTNDRGRGWNHRVSITKYNHWWLCHSS